MTLVEQLAREHHGPHARVQQPQCLEHRAVAAAEVQRNDRTFAASQQSSSDGLPRRIADSTCRQMQMRHRPCREHDQQAAVPHVTERSAQRLRLLPCRARTTERIDRQQRVANLRNARERRSPRAKVQCRRRPDDGYSLAARKRAHAASGFAGASRAPAPGEKGCDVERGAVVMLHAMRTLEQSGDSSMARRCHMNDIFVTAGLRERRFLMRRTDVLGRNGRGELDDGRSLACRPLCSRSSFAPRRRCSPGRGLGRRFLPATHRAGDRALQSSGKYERLALRALHGFPRFLELPARCLRRLFRLFGRLLRDLPLLARDFQCALQRAARFCGWALRSCLHDVLSASISRRSRIAVHNKRRQNKTASVMPPLARISSSTSGNEPAPGRCATFVPYTPVINVIGSSTAVSRNDAEAGRGLR